MSLLLIGVWGLIFFPFSWIIIVGILLVVGSSVVFLGSPSAMNQLVRLPLFRRWKPFLSTSGQAFQQILSLKVMLVALILGSLAWFAEGVAFWVVLRVLGSSLDVLTSVSIYASAILIGAVTMLPGGLVSTEGSMLGLLLRTGLSNSVAAPAVLIIRISTLWFGVALGLLALLYLQMPVLRSTMSFREHRPFIVNPLYNRMV